MHIKTWFFSWNLCTKPAIKCTYATFTFTYDIGICNRYKSTLKLLLQKLIFLPSITPKPLLFSSVTISFFHFVELCHMWKDKLYIDFFLCLIASWTKRQWCWKWCFWERRDITRRAFWITALFGVFFLEVNRLITPEAHFQKVHFADCSSNWSKGEPYASISIVLLPTVQQN